MALAARQRGRNARERQGRVVRNLAVAQSVGSGQTVSRPQRFSGVAAFMLTWVIGG